MMKMKNNIQNTLRTLPVFKAPDRIWDAIENELEREQDNISFDTSQLPDYKAPVRIWQNIEYELERTSSKPLLQYRRMFSVAAGIVAVLCLGVIMYVRLSNSGKELITYTVEKEAQTEQNTFDSKGIEAEGIGDRIANCETSPEVCSSLRYKDLKSQLDDVKHELERLENIISKDSDPQLLKFYYRLENERADIEKSIIKLFV
jgi:hypothetical protein